MKVIFFYYYYDDKIKDKKRVEFPPLGMLYLCSALENIGCEIEVIYFDENTKIEDIPNADVYAILYHLQHHILHIYNFLKN